VLVPVFDGLDVLVAVLDGLDVLVAVLVWLDVLVAVLVWLGVPVKLDVCDDEAVCVPVWLLVGVQDGVMVTGATATVTLSTAGSC